MQIFLVTGGAGFIGSHLTEALLMKGHRVRIVDDLSTGKLLNIPRDAEFFAGDINDRSFLLRVAEGCTGIFHLAAIASVTKSEDDWVGAHRVNQTGAITVFDVAKSLGGVPVVYASSAAVYGDAGEKKITECAPKYPLSSYGADKLGCELHASVASRLHNVSTLGLRFFNVYGPRQNPSSSYSGVISIFARKMRSNAAVTVYGDGGQTRDFIYVKDVVAFLLSGMSRIAAHQLRTPNVLNVCTGQATSILALAEMLKSICKSESEILFSARRAGDIRSSLGDPNRAIKALGLTAKTSLKDGLAVLI